jgi:hypothetical protein
MAILPGFDTPARLAELNTADRDAWSIRVKRIFTPLVAAFPQFYDPTESDTPADVMRPSIGWTAFPATLLRGATSQEQRWQAADASRARQDEYCEWSVERDQNGRVSRVTFTSEVPEYFEHLASRDPDRLRELYEQFTGRPVDPDDLFVGGRYRPDNSLNSSTEGRLVHLMQQTNTLGAAITLAAQATVLRQDEAGNPITTAQELVICGHLGEPLRNSDPQIAAAVNDAAAIGAEISLANPVGLYIAGIITAGIETPDGADPASFWTIERGDPDHILRANYAVPPERGYIVGDITLDGRPIQFGAQLADRVGVRLTALVKTASHRPQRRPCL